MQIHGENRDDSDVLQLVSDVEDRSKAGPVMGGCAREGEVNQEIEGSSYIVCSTLLSPSVLHSLLLWPPPLPALWPQ